MSILRKLFSHLSNITSSAWIMILTGSVSWSLTMVKSGLIYTFGMGFWGPNGHDGVWHIALAEGLSRGSWEMPVFAGETIKNYHIGFDLLLAILHKLTFIPVHTLYFQILPPLFAVLIGLLVYFFVYIWKKSKLAAFWSTFFVYFGGNWGYFVTLMREGRLNGESMFWSQQSVSTLINPPFALSLIIMFLGLIFLFRGIEFKNSWYLLLSTFLFGVLVQIKVYAGILALGGLFVAGVWQILRRRGISMLKVFAGSLLLSILLFSPLEETRGATLIFKPFWFLETLMSDSDRFFWPRYAEALSNYKLGNMWIKAFFGYFFAFIIFTFGNFGTRIVKVLYIFKKFKKPRNLERVDLILFSIIIAGIVIPMVYIQRGTPWNTIQFFYYSLVFSGVLAGVTFAEVVQKYNSKALRFLLVSSLIIITVPTSMGTLWNHYVPIRPPAMISSQELEALNFLSRQPQGVVLTQPFDPDAAKNAVEFPPRPLYLYESTGYVAAFARKTVYLEDQVNLEITGYDWMKRRSEVEDFFDPTERSPSHWVSEAEVEYFYILKSKPIDIEKLKEVEKIFENSEVVIYQSSYRFLI